MGLPLRPYGEKKRRSVVFDIIIIVLVALIVLQTAFSVTFSRVYVIGDSMLPTLTGATDENSGGGDYVLIHDATPDYGDIVVVRRGTKTLIKRVIALGGDTLYLDKGTLYIKYSGTDEFVLVEEDYVSAQRNNPLLPYNTYPKNDGELDTSGHTVADGCMFLLGDNRNISNDSRSEYGDFIIADELIGVVPEWSLNLKGLFTGWFTFWDITLPALFS